MSNTNVADANHDEHHKNTEEFNYSSSKEANSYSDMNINDDEGVFDRNYDKYKLKLPNSEVRLMRNFNQQSNKNLNNSRKQKPRVITKSAEYMSVDPFTSNDQGNVDIYVRNISRNLNKIVNITLPEDMRISKLLRKLCAENNPSLAIILCDKLKIVIGDPANASYIRKSFDILAETIVTVFRNGSDDFLDDVAEVFGKMGYVIRSDFNIYRHWIIRTFNAHKELQVYMMKSLYETIKLDQTTCSICQSSNKLMEQLKEILENTVQADVFIEVIKVIIQVCKNYPDSVEPHFADIVDIFVGWHLSTEQTLHVKIYCSLVLQELKPFWLKDIKYTASLLGHFLEDIQSCGEDMLEYPDEIDKSFGSFVGTFNTVIKCIYTSSEELVYSLGKSLLNNSFKDISSVAKMVLKKSYDNDLIISLNEYLLIIIECSHYKLEIDIIDLCDILKLQINLTHHYSDDEISSLLMVILKMVLEMKVFIPLEFVTALLSENTRILDIRFRQNESIQKCLIRIIQEILNLKNVEILQLTYKYILNDLGIALKTLPETNHIEWDFTTSCDKIKYSTHQAEFVINFYLSVLSNLATSSSSIIAMYALQPTILELLYNKLHSTDTYVWINHRAVHFSILNLLISHCRKNNCFIASSTLLKGNNLNDVFNKLSLQSEQSQSPTSEHFEIILKFLSEILRINLCNESFILIIDFCYFLILHLSKYFRVLQENEHFNEIVINLNRISTKYSDFEIINKCAECILFLFQYEILSSAVYTSIAEVCCVQMCSNIAIIRKKYSQIFSKIPLEYSLHQVNNFTGTNQDISNQCLMLQHWLYSTPTNGDIKSEYFKKFINEIAFSKDTDFIEEYLLDIFTNCWYTEQGKATDFSRFALRDSRCLISWAQLETAQFCVNNKLKTPLGKAQDTFLKIESIVKEDARILALKERFPIKNLKTLLANQKKARILLGFLEILEKVIYNADKGTAFSMPQPDKSVRTFFRVNSATCDEWFNRIRTAVDLVGIHCMEAEMVIRYTEQILKRLLKSNKTNENMFEETLMSLVWALFRNGEGSALYGLYTWTKTLTGRKYHWIKMVADQASGKREAAAEGYLAILNSEECPKSQYIREFIVDQLVLCLLFLTQYQELHKFLLKEESRGTRRITIPIIKITSKQLESMIIYNESRNVSLIDLSCWESIDKPNQEVYNDFSYYELISVVENTIGKAAISDSEFHHELADSCFEIIHNCLQECLRTRSKEHLNHLTLINHVCHKIYQTKSGASTYNMKSLCVNKNYGSLTLMRLLSWCEVFDDVSEDGEQQNINIRLDMSSIARKEGNLQFCQKELNKFFNKSDYAKRNNLCGTLTIDKMLETLTQTNAITDVSIWNENMTRGVYETCKLLYCLPKQKYQAIQLSAAAAMGICFKLESGSETTILKERAARILLTLSEWLQNETDIIITNDQHSSLVRLLASLSDVKPHPEESTPSVVPLIESSVGKLIQYGIKQSPDLAKAWSALGNWCYKWGRKMVEIRNEDNDKAGLRVSDVSAISNLVPDATADDLQKIVKILNQHQVTAEEEDIDPNETSSTEMIENQLRLLPILSNQSQDHLHSIVEIWRQAHKSVYGYYEMAADSYFKYLQLTTKNDLENEASGNCSNVTATLRLLRLVVKHALGLQEVLEEGLATTPTTPWKVIIPQLFSRMNHHEPYVRRRMSELICRVAKDAPHLIIFPTVVGAGQGQKSDLANISITSDELENENPNLSTVDSGLVCCFNSLLETLSQQAPETVNQVQLLVRELKRLTLLWDELWLVTLAQIYSEWLKKFVSFEQYIQNFKETHATNVDRNAIISGKYSLMMKPVIFVMERLYEITSKTPETNNEKMFQDKYLKIIENAIRDLKKPFNPERPNDTWQTFKSLYSNLQQKSQRKSSSTLKMMDISPILAQLKNTVISMPGVETSGKEPIYIRSVENNVHILPSKTKPKKLVFIGSNGKRYTYLFKSLEDLHLDERIMQFLSIANTMMAKSIDCNGKVSNYRAKHYSVIPLGPRSGLISWVDGVVPIFALYKKWQQREAANPKKDKQPGIVLRPSEMFYNKLNPLLIENGVKANSNRREWPSNVLTKVLKELSSETPCDLLAKELWCHSTTSSSWRQVVRNYSLSLAVMSVIGYVIGLGDRHLDNILIELSSGEILHIDYNVCFEKGHTLRVPEKVPFRMTQNLEEALGITGVQGTFWLACEHVLKALKKGRETLLTLLEAFVYDPLVDWAVGEDGAGDLAVAAYGGEALGGELRQARRQLEREVTRDTLAIRITEIKPEWVHNRDEISTILLHIDENLNQLNTYRNELKKSENHLVSLSKQMALIREAESLGTALESHQLGTVSQRYVVYKKMKDEFEAAMLSLTQESEHCDKLVQTYTSCLDDIKTNKIMEYLQESKQLLEVSNASEFDTVREFLANSAQSQFYTQCNQARKELDVSLFRQTSIVITGFEEILKYGAVVQYYPEGYIYNHRFVKFSQWSKSLCEEHSIQSCRDIVNKYQNTLGKDIVKPPTQKVLNFATQIQNIIKDLNYKLQKNYDQLSSDFESNTNAQMILQHHIQFYSDAKLSINRFLEQDIGGNKALECVTINALCGINQRFLMMENAAASSGENLVDLTSNGKWFLDELYMYSCLITELCDIISIDSYSNVNLNSAINMMRSTNSVYSSLRLINNNFIVGILPDVIQGIVSEDISILEMISSVSNLQQELIPLSELLQNLNLHLRCTILNTKSNNFNSLTIVEELKIKFYNLKEKYENDPSFGGKIFLKLNQLFDNLQTEHNNLMNAIDTMEINTDWLKLDQIKDSKNLGSFVFNRKSRSVLENIFVVKRLEVMIEFFTLCLQLAYAFKGSGSSDIYEDEHFCRPIKKYIADHILRLLLGVGPYSMSVILCHLLEINGVNIEAEINLNDIGAQSKISLDELCRKGYDMFIKSGSFSNIALNHATNLCANLDMSWRKKEIIRNMQETLNFQTENLKRLQYLSTAHFWVHEDILESHAGILGLYSRKDLLLTVANLINSLQAWNSTIGKIKEDMTMYVATVLQRLRWAVGANPTLLDTLIGFETISSANLEEIDKHCLLAAIVLKSLTSILTQETARINSSENLEHDQTFLNYVSRFEKSCIMAKSCCNAVSPVEEALVELLDPEGPIDMVWLSNVKTLLNDMTEQIEESIDHLEKTVGQSQDNLQKYGHQLTQLIFTHHQISSDVLTMLKSTLKHDNDNLIQTKEYLTRYKQYIDMITDLHGTILSKDLTDNVVKELLHYILILSKNTNSVYDDLFCLENSIKDGENNRNVAEKKNLKPFDNFCPISPSKKNKGQNQTEQKRNAYAVSVWRRIRMKLEGRDPDPTRRSSVQEQVNWMIREAMNVENLAVLYEGWTPWI